ncbi:MerR family transcriptional regulator [Lacipirellula limnantheis]|uniref:Uncharacterized protein n=1 Tax=Lacipirellula limnantheis TaxID=2528024 RepID=A0A517U1E8_9BACT|nr:helix-turn-helix domain-containing protein [Lacipirellula limnantheis]QDT74439.1 hypothetical protein I41_36350 [Lacipirellula limnantheis]
MAKKKPKATAIPRVVFFPTTIIAGGAPNEADQRWTDISSMWPKPPAVVVGGRHLPKDIAAEVGVETRTIAKYAKLAGLPPRPPGRGLAFYTNAERIAILKAFVTHSSGDEKRTCEKLLAK